MADWGKILLAIAAIGTAVAVTAWVAYEWAKRKVQEWLEAQGLQLTWLQRVIVQYERTVSGIIATVFVNGKTLAPDAYAPVAQQTYTSTSQIQEEKVRAALNAGQAVVAKDVTPMFS